MNYDPIWISTVAHLKEFTIHATNYAYAIRHRKNFQLPISFPQVKTRLLGGVIYLPPSPLIMISNGILNIEQDELKYTAYQMQLKGCSIINLNNNLMFTIKRQDIKSISMYEFTSPINPNVIISFSRVVSENEGLLKDVLITIGTKRIINPNIKKQNQELFTEINRHLEKRIS
jgi:hypothetical protein